MGGMNNPPGTPRDDGEMPGSFLNPFQSESVSRASELHLTSLNSYPWCSNINEWKNASRVISWFIYTFLNIDLRQLIIFWQSVCFVPFFLFLVCIFNLTYFNRWNCFCQLAAFIAQNLFFSNEMDSSKNQFKTEVFTGSKCCTRQSDSFRINPRIELPVQNEFPATFFQQYRYALWLPRRSCVVLCVGWARPQKWMQHDCEMQCAHPKKMIKSAVT